MKLMFLIGIFSEIHSVYAVFKKYLNIQKTALKKQNYLMDYEKITLEFNKKLSLNSEIKIAF